VITLKNYTSIFVSLLLVSTCIVDGVPGPWRATNIDVIVQGFTTGGGPNTTPPDKPPVTPTDPTVLDVAKISKATLKDKSEAMAVAALVDALYKANVGDTFKEALEMALPIADSSLKSEGRLVKWGESVMKITSNPLVLKAGLQQGFDIDTATLETIAAAAFAKDVDIPAEAKDLTEIIKLIQLILDLLRNLGII
jgi:hypothetical protein